MPLLTCLRWDERRPTRTRSAGRCVRPIHSRSSAGDTIPLPEPAKPVEVVPDDIAQAFARGTVVESVPPKDPVRDGNGGTGIVPVPPFPSRSLGLAPSQRQL